MSDILDLVSDVKEAENPALKAAKLSFYITDELRNQKLNLYEAYLLQQEVIHYTRDGYILPAWNEKVRISTCLALLNQCLLAQIFHDGNYVQLLKNGGWRLSDCATKREHITLWTVTVFS